VQIFNLKPAPFHSSLVGATACVRGWGIIDPDPIVAATCFLYPLLCPSEALPTTLQELTETINPNQACQQLLNEAQIPYTLNDGLVCSSPKGYNFLAPPNKGPCVGDSGSPLIMKKKKR